MKLKTTFLFILFSILSYCQDFKFEEVVKVDSTINKHELFNRARVFALENLAAQNSKVDIYASEDMISGSGRYDYRADKKYKGYACVEGPIIYKFNIYVKEGRYKYIFHSFEHKGSRGSGCRPVNYGLITNNTEAPAHGKGIQYNLGWEDVKLKVSQLIETKTSKLKHSMNQQYEGSKEW